MPTLSQSPILQALGYAIANSLWQMAMVWIVYVLLNSLFKFRSEIKYRIAVAAQVTGFAWFIVTLQYYYQECSQAVRVAEAFYLQNGETVILPSEKGSLLSYFLKAEQVLPYLSVAYLLLLVFLTIRWFRAYRYTQLVRLNGLHKIDVDWKLFVAKVAGQLGIKQKVRIYLSELVQSPVTIGFLKPVILVPIASINHLSAQQLEAVILHELAHIRRHDYLLNIVLSIIELGLFFNPFTRLITKSISKERENSCDDWVIQYQYNPSMYAEALLRIAVMQKNPAMAMYAVKTKGELLSRVQRMVHQKDSRFNYRHQLLALLLMTGILSSIAWFDPSAIKAQDVPLTAAEQAVVLQPLATKVNNPFVNPLSFLNEPIKAEVKKIVAENQKQLQRSRRHLATADREFELPEVMPPVAIENLKELEKNITSIRKETRRGMMTAQNAAALVKLAQNHVYNFDTLRFNGNITFFNQENWQQITDELRKSQQAIEDAWRKGTLSKTEAKKIQGEIEDALRDLREIKVPLQFREVPFTSAGAMFYRPATTAPNIDADKEKAKVMYEKKKHHENEAKLNKAKKEAMDSVRRYYVAGRGARVVTTHQPEVAGYMAINEKTPMVIVDNPPVTMPRRTPPTLAKAGAVSIQNGQVANTYTYVYTESEDECEKANKLERSRRVVVINGFATGGSPRTKPVPRVRKPAQVSNGNCNTSVAPAETEKAEAHQFEIELH